MCNVLEIIVTLLRAHSIIAMAPDLLLQASLFLLLMTIQERHVVLLVMSSAILLILLVWVCIILV